MTLGLTALVSSTAIASPVVDEGVWMADFDKAVAVAKAEGKNLLVDFTGSDWCGWCKRLHKEVFAHESWETAATKEYVLVALDFPRDEEIKAKVPNPKRNAELSDMYGIQGFPTILLMTPDGDVFGQTGYQEGGPEAYLTHMAELKKEGLPLLEAVLKFETEYKAAEGEARLALWNRGAEMLKKNGGQMPGARRIVPIVEEGLTLDPKNEKGLLTTALTALFEAGLYKENYFAAAVTADPANASGLYERALVGRLENVNSEETMLSSLEAVDAFDKVGKVHDKATGVKVYSIAGFFAWRHKQDDELASKYAEKAVELGGYADETFGDLLRQILGTDEDEAGEEVEEAEDGR